MDGHVPNQNRLLRTLNSMPKDAVIYIHCAQGMGVQD